MVPKIKCNRARVTIFAQQHCCMNIRSEEVGQMHIDIRSKEDETTYPLVCWLFNRYA